MMDISTRALIERIGNDRMQEITGTGYKMVRLVANRGWFPPKWHLPLSRECQRLGIDCPPELFQPRHAEATQ